MYTVCICMCISLPRVGEWGWWGGAVNTRHGTIEIQSKSHPHPWPKRSQPKVLEVGRPHLMRPSFDLARQRLRWSNPSFAKLVDNSNAYMYIYLYMYVYMCTYVRRYVRTYVCMYACMYLCLRVCMSVCLYVYKCVYVCMRVCVYVCVCLSACLSICLSVCMYVRTYVRTYVCVCMYVGM